MNLNTDLLQKKFGKNLIIKEDLSKYSWFNLGGPADIFFRPENKDQLIKFLSAIKKNNYKIHDTKIVVSDKLSALSTIKKGKNSSMWNSIHSQIDLSTDVTLSAGNTGVLLVMSKMILKTLEDVDKPALAGLWPNEINTNVVLDLGANVECS